MRKILLILLIIAAGAASRAWAIPAKKGFQSFTQSDGSVIDVQALGDEHFHSLVTTDGLMIVRSAGGDFHYVGSNAPRQIIAHNRYERTEEELSLLEELGDEVRFSAASASAIPQSISARVMQAQQTGELPTEGKVKVPIIVVEYADKAVSNSLEAFKSHFCEGAHSARQYFIDQSNGKFDPQFDVYGVYKLSENRASYGGNNTSGSDQGVGKMVAEACDLATAGSAIRWADYDNNADGVCDVVIVVYAGVGEAQAAATVPQSVWPCQWTLTAAATAGDGPGARTYNGITVNKFAVFNEVNGRIDSGTTLDGIGTFCHEFAHCLGLPDFYVTGSGGGYAMGSWSLMDYGSYNDNGNTPVGFSAYEKSCFGWVELETPKPDTEYTLPVFNAGSASTDRALKLTNDANACEYFVVENRRKQGWDAFIKDEGVMVSHITYIPARWNNHTVNDYAVKLVTIVPADGEPSTDTEDADLYGERNHALTDSSTPAAELNLGTYTENYPMGHQGFLGKPLTEMYLNADGTASVRYCDVSGVTISADAEQEDFGEVFFAEKLTKQIQIKGVNVTADTRLSISGSTSNFSVDKTTLSADDVNGCTTVNVVFAPRQYGELSATLTIACDQYRTIEIPLRGKGMVKSYAPQLKGVDPATVTSEGFRLEWTDATAATAVKGYALKLSSDLAPDTVINADFSSLEAQTNKNGALVDCIKTASQFLPEGWTVKSHLYIWDGHISPYGQLTTTKVPTHGRDKLTVVVTAMRFNEDEMYQNSTITVKTSKGSLKQKVEGEEKRYVFVLDCDPTEEAVVLVPYLHPLISSIVAYAGDARFDIDANEPLLEGVDSYTYRYVKGIMGKSYDATGLDPATSYRVKIQASYLDGTYSEWTSPKIATTDQIDNIEPSLADLFKNAAVGDPISVKDGTLACVGVMGDGRTIITKDNNGYADKDVAADGEIDFVMQRTSFMRGHDEWDQSNWVALTLPEPLSDDMQVEIMGRSLNGVGGTVADVDNPGIAAAEAPSLGEEVEYEGNTFITPNFLGTQKGANVSSTFFFVKPKPNELAVVQWAMWSEQDGCFKTPTSVGESNREGLSGSFYADFSKYEGTTPELVDGGVYSFFGMITVESASEAKSGKRKAESQAGDTRYMVYPLTGWRLEGSISDGLVTGVSAPSAGKHVASVRYVSLTGASSPQPFQGANVVVTTYTDGSRTVAKQMK